MASEPHRLDVALEARGLVRSRARARDAILRGTVKVNGQTVTKPGHRVTAQMSISIDDPTSEYVSRAALKLIAGLDASKINPKDMICLDLGASTGGFSQVLLERQAAKIYAVDVGHSQLAPEVANDARVVQLDKTNASALDTSIVPDQIDLILCDISFVALEKVIGPALQLVRQNGKAILLFKPQFQVGKANIGKGGIVTDQGAIDDALLAFKSFMEQQGWHDEACLPSPIKGGDGNQEYLRVFSKA
jgi:23S rRNA (cytidine1920-2'-O)/16S rRNA (cytidine1409-2'-O)-methyltransferase